jgi:hypothetical protein
LNLNVFYTSSHPWRLPFIESALSSSSIRFECSVVTVMVRRVWVRVWVGCSRHATGLLHTLPDLCSHTADTDQFLSVFLLGCPVSHAVTAATHGLWSSLSLPSVGPMLGIQASALASDVSQEVHRRIPASAVRVRAGSVQVGFVVDEIALGLVCSEYLAFLCRSFHRVFHIRHHPSSWAGLPGRIAAEEPIRLSLTQHTGNKINYYLGLEDTSDRFCI